MGDVLPICPSCGWLTWRDMGGGPVRVDGRAWHAECFYDDRIEQTKAASARLIRRLEQDLSPSEFQEAYAEYTRIELESARLIAMAQEHGWT